ncbi:MAG: putative pyridoxal phosphate-dependent aminotransferase EpsN [Deltaproteobacteria bacterium ADurb.Bin022]|nr:MAG: putative pyridoxal phosphate-dependent aminotransferase EpsN [Deltaproteobacteria bacterium ADurb.Bin022]
MIPVNEPLIGAKEIEYVNDCLQTGWISSAGRYIVEFEEKWANYCGMQYGIAMSNGTTALQAALACINLQPGDKVIMPSFTIISCAQAIIYNGGIPLLVDCDPHTWCMDVQQVREKVESEIKKGDGKLKAIMPVHIYGHPVDMDQILDLAEKYHLQIIEDAAEAHGAEYLTGRNTSQPHWKRCGGFGHVSAFSFYANKLITTGEGGMVLTNDPVYADKARALRNLCFLPEQRFLHRELGHNFRLTNLQAAIGLGQLERIDEIVARKRWMGQAYTERLKEIKSIQLPVEESWAKSVYWMYGIVLDESTGMDAVQFSRKLKEKGVETRPFFLGMHQQPVFQKMGLFHSEKYPETERIARQGLYLPSGLTLSETNINLICNLVKETYKET